jgi:hypothetical protein
MPPPRRKTVNSSRLMMYMGILSAGLRLARRLLRDEPEVLYRTVIRAGDTFEILSRKPPRK